MEYKKISNNSKRSKEVLKKQINKKVIFIRTLSQAIEYMN